VCTPSFFFGFSSGLTLNGVLSTWRQQNKLSTCPTLDYQVLLKSRPGSKNSPWLLPPLDHPEDPAHCLVTGTGLTHLGSTEARDQMHKTTEKKLSESEKTDSQKIFEMGLQKGKPSPGTRGVQPEWFYKGTGTILRGHNDFLDIPEFTIDGGEEPEVVGGYIIGPDGVPYRLGYTVCNEWSDHPVEKVNYLWLAPSKLRVCAMGPELVLLKRFDSLRGRCRITRGEESLYDSGTILTGEENMCHSLVNIEDHHFKYPEFRIPGDVHLHSFGTSKLSFPNRKTFESGDRIEIGFEGMGPPLVSFVKKFKHSDVPVGVKAQQHLMKYE